MLWAQCADLTLSPPEQQQQAEGASLAQKVSQLAGRVQELSAPGALDSCSMPVLKQQLWDLEASSAEQRKELERQTANVDHLEQVGQPCVRGDPAVQGVSEGAFAFGSFSCTRGWSWRLSG